VRKLLQNRSTLTERKMFGGIAFMLNGNMCCGVLRDELIVRVAPEHYDATLAKAHTRKFDFTGKPMQGFVVVRPKGTATAKALKGWVEQRVAFVRSLPRKPKKKKARAR